MRRAGYTGLWTAYYSRRLTLAADHHLEARFAGFGASGRNGGGCPGWRPDTAADGKKYGRDNVVAWQRTSTRPSTRSSTSRPRRHPGRHRQGGNLEVARNAAQARRLRAEADEDRVGHRRHRNADRRRAGERIRVDHLELGSLTRTVPDPAGQLARGWPMCGASRCDDLRADPVTSISPAGPRPTRAWSRAADRASGHRGFTAVPGLRRRWLPMKARCRHRADVRRIWKTIG